MQKSFKEELAGCVYGIREPFNLDVWADIFINLSFACFGGAVGTWGRIFNFLL